MTTTQVIVLAVVAVAAAVAVTVFIFVERSRKLRARFGPEYNRAVAETGNRFKAEAKLGQLEKRVSGYSIHPLASADRERFIMQWRSIQSKFVDDPNAALTEADLLLSEAMAARGYPMSDFDQRAAELSVDHAGVVQNYRAGHEIAVRHAQGRATTEELRQAMIHYRALFDDLMEMPAQYRSRAAGASD